MNTNSIYILEEKSVFEDGTRITSHNCAYESSKDAFAYVSSIIKDDNFTKNVEWDIDFGNVKHDKVAFVGRGYFMSTFDDDEGEFIEGTMTITITRMHIVKVRRAKDYGVD